MGREDPSLPHILLRTRVRRSSFPRNEGLLLASVKNRAQVSELNEHRRVHCASFGHLQGRSDTGSMLWMLSLPCTRLLGLHAAARTWEKHTEIHSHSNFPVPLIIHVLHFQPSPFPPCLIRQHSPLSVCSPTNDIALDERYGDSQ